MLRSMTITRSIVLLAVAQVLTGCGSSRPLVGPSSVPPAPSPAGRDTGSRVTSPIPRSERSLASGLLCSMDRRQVLAVTSDAAGRFSLSGEFGDATTISRDQGRSCLAPPSRSQSQMPERARVLDLYFRLAVFDPPANIAGDYALTFTADASCTSLPAEARDANLRGDDCRHAGSDRAGRNALQRRHRGCARRFRQRCFPLGVAGNFVNLEVWNGEGPGVVERLAPRTFVGLFGYAATTISTSDTRSPPRSTARLNTAWRPPTAPLPTDARQCRRTDVNSARRRTIASP